MRIGPDVEPPERVKSADVVQAHDMVGMGMGEDDRVDHIDGVGDALKAKLGSRVDQHAAGAGRRNDNGGASAAVVGIGAGADFAVAADHRNAGAGAGAEEKKFHRVHGEVVAGERRIAKMDNFPGIGRLWFAHLRRVSLRGLHR